MLPTPLALIAEITHRCPLHCVYCSNPLEMQKAASELSTEDWVRVFGEAGKLGVLHLHLTGGEPLARADLTELIAGARAGGLYVNLITSGIGLAEARLAALVEAGLEHIQLSFQDSREAGADEIAGTRSHARKLQLAQLIRQFKIAFTVNAVVHRQNLDHLDEIIAMAEELGADRLEIANVQYYGWALRNRDSLLPTREQVEQTQRTVSAAAERLRGRMRIDYVAPDYYARYPKACMGGWGRQLLLIDPAGQVLPCHAAGVIPGMEFDNVREHPLDWIWRESAAFQRFRGEDWMPEPCRSCERRAEDFGGCRCQAFLLTGDAAATDPVCTLAPTHGVVEEALAQISSGSSEAVLPSAAGWVYRPNPDASK
ncbi:MAG: pyrroloquinoline quinone biosynthesis protein PqqE [Terriglobales bacterium]